MNPPKKKKKKKQANVNKYQESMALCFNLAQTYHYYQPNLRKVWQHNSRKTTVKS